MWEERCTYRGRLKGFVEAEIKNVYPEIFPSTPAPNQLAQANMIYQRINHMLGGLKFCHRSSDEEPNKYVSKFTSLLYIFTNAFQGCRSFLHPALKALVIKCFYDKGKEIALNYADIFQVEVPIPAIALVITLVILVSYEYGVIADNFLD